MEDYCLSEVSVDMAEETGNVPFVCALRQKAYRTESLQRKE